MGKRILVVDNDPNIRKVLEMHLSQAGYTVEHAENGKRCVQLLGEYPPDLVLLDLLMPIMDGHEATRILRAQGYQGKIAALTASVMAKDTEEAKQDGCDYFIPKPLEKDFIQQIQSILYQ